MTQDYFDASMGTLWVQPDGPDSAPQYMGCHDVADIVEPGGEVTKRYCRSRRGHGMWDVALTSQGIPADVTTTITTFVGKTRDFLQKLANKSAKCPFPVYVHQALCGRMDVFLAYDAGTLLEQSRFTSRTKSNMVAREGTAAAEQAFALSASPPLVEYWPLRMTRLTTAEAQNARDLDLYGEDRCVGPCGNDEEYGDEIVVVFDAAGAATPNVQYSEDAGVTFVTMATDPFAVSEHVSSVTSYPTGRDAVRHMVARGVTDAANPAEVAVTDNNGAGWVNYNVGATNAEFMPWNGCLFSFDPYHIWACTDTGGGLAGNIYFSNDSGATWTLQGTGADALNCIDFANYDTGLCVGDTNEILFTNDGGETWSTITGPAAQAAVDALCCVCLDSYRWKVGYADGEWWVTFNGGATWALRALPMPPGMTAMTAINGCDFYDECNGALAVTYAVGATVMGAIFRTFDGGYDWEVYPVDAAYTVGATGMAAVKMANPNLVYGVGDICAATATIYKLSI